MRRTAPFRGFPAALTLACAFVLATALALGTAGCARKDTTSSSSGGVTPAPAGASGAASWRAHGNEPFWSVEIAGTKITWRTPEEVLTGDVSASEAIAGGRRTTGEVAGRALVVTALDRTCHDGMSGMVFPHDVTVRFGDREFKGCGGSPATLLQGREWRVVEIAGKPLVSGSRVTMSFGKDGRVGGHASCNSYSASYEVGGEGVTFGDPVATLKACAEPLLNQEAAFLGTLRAAKRFDVDPTGVLVLSADDGGTIRATR